LVIPDGEVKELDPTLFEDEEEHDIDHSLNTGIITSQQIVGYKKFIEEDSVRLLQAVMRTGDDIYKQLDLAKKKVCQISNVNL
jgi:hypothetical protein